MATTGHVYRDTWYSGQRCHCCNLTDADHAARRAAQAQTDLMTEARGWLADLEWADEPDFAAMSDERIRAGVQRHYDGGWAAFAADAA
jgi:hypothetical protein